MQTYGLKQLKVKVSGDAGKDRERLLRIADLFQRHTRGPKGTGFSLDGNEQFRSVEAFRDYWSQLTTDAALGPFWEQLLFVEQPFHRSIALDPVAVAGLREWADRPQMIIDESDAELDSLSRALSLGYHGTSHKNCKGVFKSLANSCLLAFEERQSGQSFLLTGEDLANIGPVALLQDLAVAAQVGVRTIERNGHHYFAGLSMFPRDVQQQMLDLHGDLYHRTRKRWPALTIEGGILFLDSVTTAPFGVHPRINVELFTPLDHWQKIHKRDHR
jgi:hypothetical protein